MGAVVEFRPSAEPEIRRRFVTVPGGPRIAYVEAGAGPDLILVHGALTALEDMWLGPMATLAKHFRVVALDRPGHGESEHVRLADASVWRQAEIVRDVTRELGLSRPVVVGHSFGGAVALAHGMAYPDETDGVVAVSPICFPEVRLEHFLFGLRAAPFVGEVLAPALRLTDAATLPILWPAMFLPQTMPTRFATGFPFALAGRADRLVADGENANMLFRDLTRSALAYGSLRVPVEILCGGADVVTNPAMHGALASVLIPGARLTWLNGLGHMLHHFRPDAVLGAALAVGSEKRRCRRPVDAA
jgi:pimeloyl-ACP methyl ester carboxylesterase